MSRGRRAARVSLAALGSYRSGSGLKLASESLAESAAWGTKAGGAWGVVLEGVCGVEEVCGVGVETACPACFFFVLGLGIVAKNTNTRVPVVKKAVSKDPAMSEKQRAALIAPPR